MFTYIVFGVTWLNRQYIAFEVNTLFLKQKICIKYVAINTYLYTYDYEFLNMTEFLTVSNLLDQTITRLEKKKQDEREGILSTGSYLPHLCAGPNAGMIDWLIDWLIDLLIDWLVLNAYVSSISAISWREQIVYENKTPAWPLEIKRTSP